MRKTIFLSLLVLAISMTACTGKKSEPTLEVEVEQEPVLQQTEETLEEVQDEVADQDL
jgi:outer membrane biogenesis lipoprotein LolB